MTKSEPTTAHASFSPEGYPLQIPNKIVVDSKDFWVSYNNYDTALLGGVTTALVHTDRKIFEHYYVLNGNHSEKYKKIVYNGGGINECLEYFFANIDKKNKYSEMPPGISHRNEEHTITLLPQETAVMPFRV